jgi:hypothetical protein
LQQGRFLPRAGENGENPLDDCRGDDGMNIVIEIAGRGFPAELNDSATAAKVADALPIEAMTSTWGEEIYFTIPVETKEENAVETVEAGDLAFWPVGNAFCIFFGPTPMSRENEIRPYSPVNVIGRLRGALDPLRGIEDGEPVTVRAEGNS